MSQFFEYAWHGFPIVAKRRVTAGAPVFTSRSITVTRPARSSQTLKRTYARLPSRLSDRKASVGARFPAFVTVTVPPPPPAALRTTSVGFDVALPVELALFAVTTTLIV